MTGPKVPFSLWIRGRGAIRPPRLDSRFLALTLAVSLALTGGVARAQTGDAPTLPPDDEASKDTIVEIRVEGGRRVELEAVKRALRNKEGRAFDAARTADDLRSLWALNYFSDVQLLVQRMPNGIAYVVRVTERPSIRQVSLSGNDELTKDDLKDALDLKAYSILDQAAIRRNAKKIQDKYVEKGFFLAEVTPETRPVADSNEVDVVFVIREHSKVQVKEINLIGAVKVPVEDLKGVMGTKEGGWLSFFTGEGTYREELFQRDLYMLQGAYYDRGFVNVKVDKPVVTLSPDKRHIFISIHVDEGEQFRVGKIDFSGDLLVGKDELHKKMTTRPGDVFNRSQLLGRDIQSVTDLYYDSGFAYTNVVPLTAIDAEKKIVDLNFEIQKGQQVTIERIDIVGNTKTRDKVIRRQLRVYEQELFNGTGIRISKERVNALGYFETVDVTHKPGRDQTHVVVQVEVKEKSTGQFQVGLGFSNVESFIFTAQVAQQNALGWGVSISASAQISGLRNMIQLQYYDQYFLDSLFSLSIDFYRTQADYFGFLREATGGSLSVGYNLPFDILLSAGYTRELVRVEPGNTFDTEIPLANQFRNGWTSSVRLTAQWDRRNNRLFPSSGYMLYGSAELAPSWLGSDFAFARFTAFGRFYYPLPLGIVFKVNAQIGYIHDLDPENPLPISENFYLGGINSVRGYFLRSIAPTTLVGTSGRPDANITSFPIGGDKQFILNVEIEFPIFEKVGIRGVIFYDAGNAFARGSPFFVETRYNLPLGLFHSVGFGFRWFSPIGPLRFEWGIPLNRRSAADQPVLFEFTIGNFF
jgi:outer membrane protein insertion porin family